LICQTASDEVLPFSAAGFFPARVSPSSPAPLAHRFAAQGLDSNTLAEITAFMPKMT
jgi:hypothetical protein